MSNTPASPANWYPDPLQRHQLRYWSGSAWTEHVSDNGVQGVDPPTAGSGPVTTNATAEKIQQQVQGSGLRGAGLDAGSFGAGGGTLFTEPVLVVNQKKKLIELTNQYAVYNKDGQQIGYVSEVGQSAAKKAIRLLSNLDQFLTHRLQICDMAGQPVLQITRPAKVLKSQFIVTDGPGNEIGRIRQENVFGKIRMELTVGDQVLGSIKAENWRAWNFRIEDAAGNEVARIDKTWEGIAATLFTTADNYVVHMKAQIPQPLLSLVVASALSVDTALKQDNRGFN